MAAATTATHRSLLLAATGLLAVACSSGPEPASPAGAAAASTITRGEVQALLDEQAAAWNRGDLRGFMQAYRRGDEVTFMGSRGLVRGWDRVLSGYEKGYPDAASRGRLSFELVEVRGLGTAAALALGRFQLERQEPASGWFTLVLERTPAGLKITHDHTS